MSIWGKLKTNAKIGVQYIKEKTGTTQVEIDPEYEAANQKLNLIQENNTKFMTEFKEIIDLLPEINESCINISNSFSKINSDFNDNFAQISNSQESFFHQITDIMKDEFIEPVNQKIIEDFKETMNKIKALLNLRDERRKTQLMCDSLRDQYEKSRKETPEAIVKIRKKYDAKQEELKNQTNDFIGRVNEMWDNRFVIIDEPMKDFVNLLFAFCFKTYGYLSVLNQSLTEEELSQQFEPETK